MLRRSLCFKQIGGNRNQVVRKKQLVGHFFRALRVSYNIPLPDSIVLQFCILASNRTSDKRLSYKETRTSHLFCHIRTNYEEKLKTYESIPVQNENVKKRNRKSHISAMSEFWSMNSKKNYSEADPEKLAFERNIGFTADKALYPMTIVENALFHRLIYYIDNKLFISSCNCLRDRILTILA